MVLLDMSRRGDGVRYIFGSSGSVVVVKTPSNIKARKGIYIVVEIPSSKKAEPKVKEEEKVERVDEGKRITEEVDCQMRSRSRDRLSLGL